MFLNNKLLCILMAAFGWLLAACKEEKIGPLPHAGSGVPEVSHLQVLNIHGGAKITYVVPADPNLLYVQAEWEDKGVRRNTKSSYYSDTLYLEGFGDTTARQITIYSVNKNEQRSGAQSITINPLTPPVAEVFKTLAIKPDFGGVNIAFQNETHADIVINVLTPDSTGKLVPANAFYTSLRQGAFSTRGYDSIPREFSVYVTDRWGNLSDTLRTTLQPYYEKQLNKSLFREVNPYPGDINSAIYSAAYPMNKIWDNSTSTIFVTASTNTLPESFTIDLGVTATLSRMKFYQRQSTAFYFSSGTPSVFDVYGSNSPAPDGSWDSWTLINHCVSVKPSGMPLGTNTNDDVAQAQNGEDFNFPLSATGFRYIRFRVNNTWGNAVSITFSEITLWGAF